MAERKAWVVAVSMGYGHLRAVYPLKDLAYGGRVIMANDYEGMPDTDRRFWSRDERFYNFISRVKSRGPLGRSAFNVFDYFQKIDEFYPLTASVKPTLQLRAIYRRIRKGWGEHLINKLNEKPLPLLTPFFTVAHMAEYRGYAGPIYLLVTDSDVSRAWAPFSPEQSRIRYLAPTERVVERLKEYGVPPRNITFTGFPLPEELVGRNSRTAKTDLLRRLKALDPEGSYRNEFGPLIKNYLGKSGLNHKSAAPTLTFAVGGAGAQTEIGCKLVKGLTAALKEKKINLCLAAGVSERAAAEFRRAVERFGLAICLGENIYILFAKSKDEYFKKFNEIIANTDVLWTKPSELSFYAALGLPIIMSPPVGSQEGQNRKWLSSLHVGLDQLAPEFTAEWLFDWLRSGRLAEMAMEGFIKMERGGAGNVRKMLFVK